MDSPRKEYRYRATGQVGKNLPLTEFQQFWKLVGHYCSYLLPRQDDGIPKYKVNRRFSLTRRVTLYMYCIGKTRENVTYW